MTSLDLAIMGTKNLLRRKARTILTVLGVIIGTASIVVMISLGLGMNRAFEEQLEAYGSLTQIEVYDNSGRGMYISSDSETTSTVDASELKFDDTAIEKFEALDHVDFALGMKRFDGTLYAGKLQSWADITAVDFDKLHYLDIELSQGSLPQASGNNEVLVGFQVPNNFYNPNSRRGYENSTVDIMNTKLEILPTSNYYDGKRPKGIVITPTGITSEDNWDYAWGLFVDYDTFTKLKEDFDRRNKSDDDSGSNRRARSSDSEESKYDQMIIGVDDIDNVQAVQEEIKAMGYDASSLTDALESMKETSGLIQAVLGGIGAVSLFVAAIGITNTMVMSIYERTKEIGVMKVIGAELKDIKRLFLFEAALIGLFGGLLGIGISYGISYLINSVIGGMAGRGGYYGSGFSSYIPYWLALLGVGFSTFIGLVAGYYPAVRATKLSALEAIRTE